MPFMSPISSNFPSKISVCLFRLFLFSRLIGAVCFVVTFTVSKTDEENFDEQDTSGTPEDRTSHKKAKMMDGTLEDPTSPMMDGTPYDPTSPMMDGTPYDPTSPMMDGTPYNPTSPMMNGIPEDRTSPKMNGAPYHPTPPKMDGSPEEPMPPEKELRVEVMRWPGWPGDNIFRILIPTVKIGHIIGRKGKLIKEMYLKTKARFSILTVPSCIKETVVVVSAKEKPSLNLSPAMKGLLEVHACIVDLTSDQPQPGIVSTSLLVADAQTISINGKQGGIIKSIQDESDCRIHVLKENLPIFALKDDKVVNIQGKPQNVHKAVELIIKHLRKFLADGSIVQVMETQMKMLIDQADQNMQVFPNDGPRPGYVPSTTRKPPPEEPPQVFPNDGPRPGYMRSIPTHKPPPHQYSNYYPPADMPDNKPKWSLSNGRDGLMGVSTPSAQPQQSFIGKTMQLHISYADAIIGNSGATITYIRRASGATITIQEMDSRMNIEINGSTSQVQAAQQMIQNVIAGGQIPSAEAPPTGQGSAGYPSGQISSAEAPRTGQGSAGYPSYNPAYTSASGPNADYPPADYCNGTNNKSRY